MSALVLAIPSKGRLQEQTLAWFADAGLPVTQSGGERGYTARIAAMPDVEVRLAAAGEIADALSTGELHLGVTGEDLLREHSPSLEGVVLATPLGFGRADLVLATPKAWLDVSTLADFAAVAAERRARTGERLRVATKYAALARAFFAERGVDDYRLVSSAGATEAAPATGAADAIIDITTSGATLAANGLKPLVDGVILRSQAQLAASRHARWSDAAFAALERLLAAAEARAEAAARTCLRVGPGAGAVETLARRLEDMGCVIVASGAFGLEVLAPRGAAADAAWIAAEDGRAVVSLNPAAVMRRPVKAYESALAALRPRA